MPKTTSQPTSSNDRTIDFAPVIGTRSNRSWVSRTWGSRRWGSRPGATGVAGWVGRAGGGAGLGTAWPDRGVAVVICGSASLLVSGLGGDRSEHEKTPDRRLAMRGWRVYVRGLAQAWTRL